MALCCSGRVSRVFTVPFLHNSMIPSVEPEEVDGGGGEISGKEQVT